jgi:IclR family transcriptional regulator, acetate operon repressor
VGKVFLAEGEMPFPQGALESAGPRSITDPDELRAELELTQARGYATALDELEPGLWAVAAPVRDASGRVVAALTVSGPTVRLEEGQLEELGQLVRDEAVVLSTRNGYDTKRGAA